MAYLRSEGSEGRGRSLADSAALIGAKSDPKHAEDGQENQPNWRKGRSVRALPEEGRYCATCALRGGRALLMTDSWLLLLLPLPLQPSLPSLQHHRRHRVRELGTLRPLRRPNPETDQPTNRPPIQDGANSEVPYPAAAAAHPSNYAHNDEGDDIMLAKTELRYVVQYCTMWTKELS